MQSTDSEFLRVYEILRTDIDRVLHPNLSEEELRSNSDYGFPCAVALTQIERRSVVRAIFALAEASCYFLRLRFFERFDSLPSLSPAQRLALVEEQVAISGSGVVHTTPMRAATMALIRMTFKVYADAFQGKLVSLCSGKRFAALDRSIKVRDRLMHPKSVLHLEVTDDEIFDAVTGCAWLNDAVLACVREQTIFLLAQTAKNKMKLALENATRSPSLPGQA